MNTRACISALLFVLSVGSGFLPQGRALADSVELPAPERGYSIAGHPSVRTRPELGAMAVRIAQSTRVGHQAVEQILGNRLLGSYLETVLPALDAVRDVPGVERVVKRFAEATENSRAVGAAFELRVGAQLVRDLTELSADVDGREVDALLRDGTVVEAKFFSPGDPSRLRTQMVHKATEQLRLRGARGQPLVLFSNEPLKPDEVSHVRAVLGERVQLRVLSSTRSGRPSNAPRRAPAPTRPPGPRRR